MYTESRPWGLFSVLRESPKYKVKLITVNPGGKLSSQSHKHRSEHWLIVRGKPTVTINGLVQPYNERSYVDVPRGVIHRLENTTEDTVEIIETQFGDYLGEDDIIRYDDIYGRT